MLQLTCLLLLWLPWTLLLLAGSRSIRLPFIPKVKKCHFRYPFSVRWWRHTCSGVLSVQSRKGFLYITKTCLYNVDPLKPHFKPHFYIVKLGFTRVYIIVLISAQKHRLWVPTIYVLSRNMKNIRIFILSFSVFLEVKFSTYLNRRVFVMKSGIETLQHRWKKVYRH